MERCVRCRAMCVGGFVTATNQQRGTRAVKVRMELETVLAGE